MKKFLRNENGLTLVELLAVVVILGIISAIAVPSIGGLIDNSRKDAHVANAQQMINAAKIAVAGDSALQQSGNGTIYVTLEYLMTNGYIESMDDPDGGTYTAGTSEVASSEPGGSFVRITSTNNSYSYAVRLTNETRGIYENEADLTRDNVVADGSLATPTS